MINLSRQAVLAATALLSILLVLLNKFTYILNRSWYYNW